MSKDISSGFVGPLQFMLNSNYEKKIPGLNPDGRSWPKPARWRFISGPYQLVLEKLRRRLVLYFF